MKSVRNALGAAVVTLALAVAASAGGPRFVSSAGVPETWADGQIVYYTDQGDLSPLLPAAQAEQFVADAWTQWTSVPLASINVSHAGELAEDVTGANFATSADIQAGSPKALVIVYDADGSVIDSLLGQGAGAAELCSTNAVIAQVDSFSDDGHIAHAFVAINGNCAAAASQLAFLQYELVRALGRVLGLDYSQLNENVVTGVPTPTGEDYAGYPVMHPLGVLCTVSGCVPNADAPRMDDRAALARLYPATTFSSSTARVSGVVRFPDWKGRAGQEMQGVNVVARLIDPGSGKPSGQKAASCVSGFLFRGNAGNPITGFFNVLGERWDAHGASDPALEGFYDLAGLEIPDGQQSATYQISLEPVNASYVGSTSVGPYASSQVMESGSAASVVVTLTRGADLTQDFVTAGGASEQQDRWEPSSFAQPRGVPLGGNWAAALDGYGDRDYYSFPAQANRTFTFDVTATDENGNPTANKALPVLGVWTGGDDENSPEVAESYFNTAAQATTRLQVITSAAAQNIVGVADYRGDGRPDFHYIGRLFYADQLTPSHIGVQGGTAVTISGLGFVEGMQVTVNGSPVETTLLSDRSAVFFAPALNDGTYTVDLADPATGATSEMIDALAVGAANAHLVLINGANPQVPVGTVAPNAITVQVVDNASGTPVAGATVLFSAPSSASIVGCAASPCSVVSDQNGMASVRVMVLVAGASTITASLPAGGSVSGTVNGLAASLEITLAQPTVYAGTGASISVPVSALVVANGAPMPERTVDFLKNFGTGTIAPVSAVTGADGTASSTVTVSHLTADLNVSACVGPSDSPCRTLVVHPVQDSSLRLQQVSGAGQLVAVGQGFAPVVLRVTDTLGNPVCGVPVAFSVLIMAAPPVSSTVTSGEVVTTHSSDPVILSSAQVAVVSDANGLAALSSITAPAQQAQVRIRAVAGQSEMDVQLQSVWIDGASRAPAVTGLRVGGNDGKGRMPMRR